MHRISPAHASAELGKQHKPPRQPTAMPEWRLICFSGNFTCCSLVHSLGSRTRKFYKADRNFEIIGARPFTVKWSHTIPLESDYLLNLAIAMTQKAKFAVQKYSTAWWGCFYYVISSSEVWCLTLASDANARVRIHQL